MEKIKNFKLNLPDEMPEQLQKIQAVWKRLYRIRSILLAIPVILGSVILAIYNNIKLPDYVGIDLQASGEYAYTVGKAVVVMGPLAVTAVCLLMMFCSRKVLYPWLISLFSLTLPLLILFTNIFPG